MRLQQINENDRDRSHGVETEINNFAIYINGRLWKVIKGVAPDHDPQQIHKADQLRRMCERKTLETGKIWTCLETSQDPTGTVTTGTSTPALSPIPDQSNKPTTNFQIFINGRSWRVFPGVGPDNSTAQKAEFKRLQNMCAKKSIITGKKWEVKPTNADSTPPEPRPHITEDNISLPSPFEPGDQVQVKNYPDIHGVLKRINKGVAVVELDISPADPITTEIELGDLEPTTVHENIGPEQRLVGQVGPTDKTKKSSKRSPRHPFAGKLVGGGL